MYNDCGNGLLVLYFRQKNRKKDWISCNHELEYKGSTVELKKLIGLILYSYKCGSFRCSLSYHKHGVNSYLGQILG